MNQPFSPIKPGERLLLSWTFAKVLSPGETIESAEWGIHRLDGTSEETSGFLDGDPDFSVQPLVRQWVHSFTHEAVYFHEIKAHTSKGQILIETPTMAVQVRPEE